MQTKSFYINKHLADLKLIETALSFKPFISYLQNRLKTEDTIKAKFYSFVLDHFKEAQDLDRILSDPENAQHNAGLLELIYGTLSPVLLSEKDSYWALSTPVPNCVFYSTDAFHRLITSRDIREAAHSMVTDDEVFYQQQQEYVYRHILKKLYHFTSVLNDHTYYSYINAETGLSRYYHIHIDTTFVDIEVKGELPELDFETIENYLHNEDGVDVLSEILPLNLFKLTGFSVITLEDVTPRRAIEDIRNAIINPNDDQKELYKSVIKSLEILTENNNVHFGLLPFLKLNGEPLFDLQSCSESILIQAAQKYGVAEETYNALVNRYEKNPKAVFFSSLSEARQQKFFFLKTLREAGIKSYGVIPVFYNKHIAGMMEIYSEDRLVFYENLLSRLEFVIPHIAQLLQNSIDYFNTCIDRVIKDNFTSIQPAVQWKFNETAWDYVKNPKSKRKQTGKSVINFKDVYPLYGAIDVRNSTVERNQALQQDMKRVLKLLLKILLTLDEKYPGRDWQELIDRANKWMLVVNDQINTSDEILIDEFLEKDAGLTLTNFKSENPDAGEIVDSYLDMIAMDCEGPAFTQRNRLETAMQMINVTVDSYFEKAEQRLQQIFPCYFEKFRTDGVEYDVYVGQAIAPKQPFQADFLRQMRMWQLTSMVDAARLTHKLLDNMPAALQTTQLIFIHSQPIDISFRSDERRFDVEGAYNIRYEIIKKRIDKVTLHNSTERLTQPGKIALVYFTQAEADEHIGYIKQLQAKNMLMPEIEMLDLEELQGVVGLRALRVSVNFDD